MSDKDGRELAGAVLDGAATTLATLATIGGPVGAGLGLASAATKLLAKLVRTLGAGAALAQLEKLGEAVRAGEGAITDADVQSDDDRVMADIASWYASDEGEHPE